MIETHIVAYYNRVVGYRNTERGISMLHSVITLMIQKMVALRDKDSSKIAIPNHHFNKPSSEATNPVHATNQ